MQKLQQVTHANLTQAFKDSKRTGRETVLRNIRAENFLSAINFTL